MCHMLCINVEINVLKMLDDILYLKKRRSENLVDRAQLYCLVVVIGLGP
jgi:hypothetical protein